MSAFRTYSLFILSAFSITTTHAHGIELVPEGRLFRPTFADPQEIRMLLGFGRDEKLTAIVGNYASILGFGGAPDGMAAHFGLEGRGFFTMRQESSRFPLETVDGMIGAYIDAKYRSMQWQLRYTHVSAHIADGLSVAAAPFSRETLSFRMAYLPDNNLQIYVGGSNIVNSFPATEPWIAQVGGSYFLPLHFAVTPFVATDLQYRAEWHGIAGSLQLGIAIGKSNKRFQSLRIFYGLYSGGDQRGQFFGQPVTSHSFGIEVGI